MSSLEEIFEKACATKEIPGAVLVAKDRSGKFSYSKAFGNRSLKNSAKGLSNGKDAPMTLDTVMWIASCTKLLTAIAALQCVERGLLELDVDITGIWEPLRGIEILKGWGEDGKPILEKPKEVVTLRRLLCHTSGIGYDAIAPDLTQWRTYNNQVPNDGITHNGPLVTDRYLVPLLFEPGTSWMYGGGMDIVGKLIEAVNPSHKNLASYFETNIFKPLGITDLAFFLDERPDLLQRFADLSVRDEGSLVVRDGSEMSFHVDIVDACGGSGLFGTAVEYIKVLESILKNDGKLLRSETAELLFTPQFSEDGPDSGPFKALEETLSDPMWNGALGGGSPFGAKRNWGLGGILMGEDAPEMRRKGTLSWSGMPNLNWWIDREKGICGIYASQVYPPGEDKSHEMSRIFERAMYQRCE